MVARIKAGVPYPSRLFRYDAKARRMTVDTSSLGIPAGYGMPDEIAVESDRTGNVETFYHTGTEWDRAGAVSAYLYWSRAALGIALTVRNH